MQQFATILFLLHIVDIVYLAWPRQHKFLGSVPAAMLRAARDATCERRRARGHDTSGGECCGLAMEKEEERRVVRARAKRRARVLAACGCGWPASWWW